MELAIKNVSKNYGKVQALSHISLKLEEGVYGLLGPNGAGKSTLIQIITGNLKPSEGNIYFNGKEIQKEGENYKRILGYAPQSQGLYDMFTAEKFLEYIALLKEMKKEEISRQVAEILETVGLTEARDRKLGGFSGGMKQRILIGQALLGNPKILILDEPTAGLDPKERIRIRNFISRISKDKIVLIATHVVSDIETIAREIILLGKGNLMGQGTPENLCKNLAGNVWECTIHSEQYPMLEEKGMVSNVQEMPGGTIHVRFLSEEASISSLQADFIDVRPVFPNIQDVYLNIFSESR